MSKVALIIVINLLLANILVATGVMDSTTYFNIGAFGMILVLNLFGAYDER